MIQLANDPNASKMSFRPSQEDGKPHAFGVQRARSAHAWPFLARPVDRPVRQDSQKPTSSDYGS